MPSSSPFPRHVATVLAATILAACGPSDEAIHVAADRLSELYDLREYELGMMEGERWRDADPRAYAPRAWYVLHTARHSTNEDLGDTAVAIAERMVARAPENPWSWFALGGALNYHRDRGKEALAATDSAVQRSTDLAFLRLRVDAVRRQESDSAALALIDSLPLEIQNDPMMLVRRGVAEHYVGNATNSDSLRDAALGTFGRARDADPMNVEAHFLPGAYLSARRRMAEALPLVERAAQLTGALDVHHYYWSAIRGRTDLTREEKQAAVRADVKALLARRGDVPSTLQAVASIYGELDLPEEQRTLEERLLAKHPYTEAAEWVLVYRYRSISSEIYQARQRGEPVDPEKIAEQRAQLEAYIARPRHIRKELLGDAYRNLFQVMQRFIREDSVVDGDRLYEVVQGMVQYEGINPHITYGFGAIALADVGAHLTKAERLAREGVAEARKKIDEQNERGVYETEGDYQRAVDWYTGISYDALGWVYFAQGRLDVAEDTLLYAYELDPKNIQTLHHLGQLYERSAAIAADRTAPGAASEAERFLAEAEKYYIKGAMVQRPGENPNDQALEGLYGRRHGSLDGFASYRANIEEIDRRRRRTEIMDERIADPEPIMPFSLASLHGPKTSSSALTGKIVVINFWGTWCSPCVVEMPEFQRFHEQYRSDPTVIVLTINNDTDPDEVREWMAKHEYDFRVLWDDGYVSRADVHAFPTTWFVDRRGQIGFVKQGWSESLAEEFSWRVEALRASGP